MVTARVPVTSAEARSMEVPRSAVTLPLRYVRPPEKVVVATPVHVPPTRARICPFVPAKSEEVAMAVGAAAPPVRLASTVFAACVASWVSASVPLIVESVEVAPIYTLPLASTASPPEVRPVSQSALLMVCWDEVAFEKTAVEEAKSEYGVPCSQSGEDVPCETVLYVVPEVKGYPYVLVMVTAPVAPETEIPAPATLDVTPVLVTLPLRYVRPPEKVVVEVQVGTPPTSARV